MQKEIVLHFDNDPDFDDLCEDLSALHLDSDGYLWIASDERTSLERLSWDGKQFARHKSFNLSEYLHLPDGDDEEIDIEGISSAGGYLWLVGSHSRTIKKPKDLPDTDNIQRMVWKEVKLKENRCLLGRIPLSDGKLSTTLPDPSRPGKELTAASLEIKSKSNVLLDALTEDDHIGPYITAGVPSKANGLDIEGLDVIGDRILLGLRGPVLLDWAIILEVEPKERDGGTLGLKKLKPDGRLYRKYFINLQGLGIRDLCRIGDYLLILAGPTLFLDGPSKVFVLRIGDGFDESVMYRPKFLFDISCGIGTDHPEGITLAEQIVGQPSVMTVFDGPSSDRKREPNGVIADVLPIPTWG